MAILKWKDYKVIVTKNRLKYLTVTSWTAAVVTGFVGAAMERGIKVKSTEVNFVIIFRIVIVLSTSIGIVYCYVAIYVSIRRHKTMRASRPMNQVVQAKLQTRVAKTCLLITVSLLATSILPGVIGIFRFILPAFPKRFPFKVMGIVLQLNSIFNPLIYCYCSFEKNHLVSRFHKLKNLNFDRTAPRFNDEIHANQMFKWEYICG